MNERIQQAIDLTKQILGDARRRGKNVRCSVSGGADSDILIDLCERTEPHFVSYVFFDTGIEYQATKDHLKYLEEKYGIEIHREKAKVPVPLGNKKYGVPFLSKRVSDMIHRLQSNGFQWEDDTLENLLAKYPKCKTPLRWWCNEWGEQSRFNISLNTWLKEFLVKNPPRFKISHECCYNVTHKIQHFLPILYFTNADRKEYEQEFDITHSNCYTEYRLIRTGCVGCPGCPFGREYQRERDVIKQYEPKLSKAIENMWGEVYEYTNKYHEFQKMMNRKYKEKKKCVCGCTEFTGDDVAMNLKYFGRDVKTLLCRGCFQNIMEMTDEQWDEAIDGFKAQRCELF